MKHKQSPTCLFDLSTIREQNTNNHIIMTLHHEEPEYVFTEVENVP